MKILPPLFLLVILLLSSRSYLEAQVASGTRHTIARSSRIYLLDLPESHPEPERMSSLPRLASAALAPTNGPPFLAASFPGLEDNQLTIPPDTMGAVGPAHLMVTLKTGVRIQTRDGLPLRTVMLSNFWESLGPFAILRECSATYCRTQSVFDPKIVYVAGDGRWIFTALADARLSTAALLIGVSDGADPTAGWSLHRIDVDRNDLTWADYPNLGFNKKWVVVQVNMVSTTTDAFFRSHLYVFGKTNLYAGNAEPFTLFEEPSSFSAVPAVTLDPDEEALYLLETANSNPRGRGELRLSAITGPVGAETFRPGIAFPSSPPWGRVVRNFAPQLGTDQRIDTVDSRMQTVIQRQQVLWAVQTLYLPALDPTHTGIQWWQLSTNGGVLQRGIIEDPAAREFYAMPSLAVNRNNDVLIGYSRFSGERYASAGYSFHAAADPANVFSTHRFLKEGEGPYIKLDENNFNRWGDYSATLVDPLDDLNFWTLQQYAAAPQAGLYRWGTSWGHLTMTLQLPRLTVALDPRPALVISFPTHPSLIYTLECTGALEPANWQAVATLTGDGLLRAFTNALQNAPAAFYRVRHASP